MRTTRRRTADPLHGHLSGLPQGVGGANVDAELLVELLELGLRERFRPEDPRRVDEHVHRPERVDRLGQNPRRRVVVHETRGHDVVLSGRLGAGVQPLPVAARHDHLAPASDIACAIAVPMPEFAP
jgi:hypothetical protein